MSAGSSSRSSPPRSRGPSGTAGRRAPPSRIMQRMADLELTRSREDRRTYVVDGVGSLRLEGWLSRRASAEAGAGSWAFARRGLLRATMEATDAAGAEVGFFDPRTIRRGGTLT